MWSLIQLPTASHLKDFETCLISRGALNFEFPCSCSENPWAIFNHWTGFLGKYLFLFCLSVCTGVFLDLSP